MSRSKTLIRTKDGRIGTFADLSADEIWDGLSEERRAGLAKALGVTSGAGGAAPSSQHAASTTQGRIAIVAHAVATDPKCKGKAKEALDILADDECVGMSANAVIKVLRRSDASDARADMRNAIRSSQGWMGGQNPPRTQGANSQSVWARAIELNHLGDAGRSA